MSWQAMNKEAEQHNNKPLSHPSPTDRLPDMDILKNEGALG